VRIANRRASALVLGDPGSCVIGVDQQLSCSGLNDRGRLGVGSPTGKKRAPLNLAKPQKVQGLPKVVQAALGDVSGCALSADHALYCWGLGFGCSGPALQKPSDAAVVALAGGKDHYCVVDANSKVRCLAPVQRGTQAMEQDTCEDYEQLDRGAPWPVVGSGNAVAATAPPLCERCAGCIAAAARGADCWNDDRGAPFGSSALSGLAHVESAHRFVQLAISTNVACAVTDEARVVCWGKNRFAQLGDGSPREALRMTPLEPRFPD
jgi:alpha-tubulin suppressor-like RCC1 family protein